MGKKKAKTGEGKNVSRAGRASLPNVGTAMTQDNLRDSDDEIDAFHAEREKIHLGEGSSRAAADEDDLDDAVMDVRGAGLSSSDEDDGSEEEEEEEEEEEGEEEDSSEEDAQGKGEEDGSDSDSDSDSDDDDDDSDSDAIDEEEEIAKLGSITENWGSNARRFYGGDNERLGQEAGSDEEDDTLAEEAAAEELRKKQVEAMDEGDFGVDDEDEDEDEDEGGSPSSSSSSSSSKKKKAAAAAAAKKAAKKAGNQKVGAAASAAAALSEEAEVLKVKRSKKGGNALSKQEKLKIVLSDSPELIDMLGDFGDKMGEVTAVLEPLLQRVERGGAPTAGGLSYLEVKHQLLLNYCINVVFYLLLKARGVSVASHPVVAQLVELRTTMEKLRPLDAKLKYQVDKLLKAAARAEANGGGGGEGMAFAEDDPMSFKPNPNALVSRDGGGGEDDDEAEDDDDDNQVYQVPKMAAVHYAETERASERAEKEARRRKKRMEKSAMLRDMREELSDAPKSVAKNDLRDARVDAEEREKQKFEEDRFIRLVPTRKEKQRKKKMERDAFKMDSLASIGDFSDLQDMARDAGAMGGGGGGGGDGSGGGGMDGGVDGTYFHEEEEGGGEGGGNGGAPKSALAKLQEEKRRMARFQNLHKTLNSVKQKAAATGKGARVGHGDADVPIRDPEEEHRRRVAKGLAADAKAERAGVDRGADGLEDYFGGEGQEGGGGGGSSKAAGGKKRARKAAPESELLAEDPFYAAVASAHSAKKKAKGERLEKAQAVFGEGREEFDDAEKRGVTWEMMKNQGLKASKRKIDRNPRVKKRVQYEKALVRRKGQVRELRTNEGDQYGGEATGITDRVSRSRKLQ